MSDSSCLMHAFSYSTPIRDEAKGGNLMHSSISFGKFTTESLSWEKWSTFSHNRYVEEAASYAQPGSVAQKKAFFEAHYKRIAARNAAALLEQQRSDDNDDVPEDICNAQTTLIITENEMQADSQTTEHKENKAPEEDAFTKISSSDHEMKKPEDMAKPLFKTSLSLNQQVSSKKRLYFSSTKASMNLKKASEVPQLPAKQVHLNNATPNVNKNVPGGRKVREGGSLGYLLKFDSTKEAVIPPVAAMHKKAPKACPTPLRTPTHQAPKIGRLKVTPCSQKRSNLTLVDTSVSGCKKTGQNWHILSAVSKSFIACKNKLQSPTLSTPFLLRNEERAARRKQKLEEKFNSKADEKVQLQTKLKEKADNEIRKFRQSFCFKARPLPDFYKTNEKI